MNPWVSTQFYVSDQTVIGSDNNLYISLANNTNHDPTTSPTYWRQESSSGPAHGISELTISVTPSEGDTLTYTGGNWVPSAPSGTSGQGDYAEWTHVGTVDPTSGSFDFVLDEAAHSGTSVAVDSSSEWVSAPVNWGYAVPKVTVAGTYAITFAAPSSQPSVQFYDAAGIVLATAPVISSGVDALFTVTVYLPANTHLDVSGSSAANMTLFIQKVAGGGGSSAGSPVVRKFPFAYDTPGLLTGATVYTPTVGDILLDAWIEIDTAWNGTTPQGDVGQFLTVAISGLFSTVSFVGTPLDMSRPDVPGGGNAGTSLLWPSTSGDGSAVTLSQMGVEFVTAFGKPGARLFPAKLSTADPFKVVVSQDGTKTGADPGATQGAAVLYLVTVTPV